MQFASIEDAVLGFVSAHVMPRLGCNYAQTTVSGNFESVDLRFADQGCQLPLAKVKTFRPWKR